MKQITFVALILSASFIGCTSYDTNYHGKNVSLEPKHNMFGIIKVEAGSYAPATNANINLNLREIYGRRVTSGDKVTLFWGAVTLTDY